LLISALYPVQQPCGTITSELFPSHQDPFLLHFTPLASIQKIGYSKNSLHEDLNR